MADCRRFPFDEALYTLPPSSGVVGVSNPGVLGSDR